MECANTFCEYQYDNYCHADGETYHKCEEQYYPYYDEDKINLEYFKERGITNMKDREIACKSYVCEGNCSKGREGTFRSYCQTCNKYDPIKGGRPARKNLRREKREKFLNDRRNWA